MIIPYMSDFKRINHMIDYAKEHNLLEYVDLADCSARNKQVFTEYVNGKSIKDLANEYNVTVNRINQIIRRTYQLIRAALKKQGDDWHHPA